MAAEIYIIGKGKVNQAKLSMDPDGLGYEYTCTKGAWCSVAKIAVPAPGGMIDVINDAIWHVDMHDSEDERGGPEQPPLAWGTNSA